MSIKSISTLAAATAAILGVTVIEASAGPNCGTGGGARYSSAPRAVSVAPKPVAAKAAPAARQNIAQVDTQPAKPLKVANGPADAGSGGGEVAVDKTVKPAPAPIQQAAPAKPPVAEAPIQQSAQASDNVETSVSAIAARLAAMNGRRPANIE